MDTQKVSCGSAVESLNNIINWAAQNDVNYEEISMLHNLRQKALQSKIKNSVQKNITDYFLNK